MVDLNKSKASEIGEDSPTDASKQVIDNIVDEALKDAKVEQVPQEPEEKPAEEEVQEEIKDAVEEPEEEVVEEKEEPEEDLIPKSKVQDRIDKLTSQIKKLEAENQKLSQKKPESKEDKLDRLSVQELKQLRRQTRLAQRTESEQSRLEELMELEELVDEKIDTAPNRFRDKQVQNLASVLPEFAKIDPSVVNQKGKLWETASGIYSKLSSLQKSEMGQVEAMLLAAEHLSVQNSVDISNDKGSTLQRQVNNLKKKTSLAGKTRVAQEKGVNLQKLRDKANYGSMADKEEFVKQALVPEDFLQI